MRVFKTRYYILKSHPGISGFQQWNKLEYRVATGYKARNNKSSIVREFLANGRGKFRLEDGHLPDFQPIVREREIYDWLDTNPFQTVFIINPGVYDLNETS